MTLLITLPIGPRDVEAVHRLLEWIKTEHPTHDALMVIDPSLSGDDRKMLLGAAEKAFLMVHFSVAQLHPHETGWPDGPNGMFRYSSLFVPHIHRGPWYFMEPDCVPTRETWAIELEDAYLQAGRPFMGAVEMEWYVNRPTGQKLPKSRYLMGSAIYPAEMRRFTNEHLFCRGRAFDVAIAPDIMRHVAGTKLIQNNWQTCNYRLEGGQIVCDAVKHQRPGEGISHPVSPEAAVVHGCRDASLISLLSEKRALISPPRCKTESPQT